MITFHDMYTPLRPLFTSRLRPKPLLEAALPILQTETGVFGWQKAYMENADAHTSYQMLHMIRTDGFSATDGQQGWGLFNPARSREASDWEFNTVEQLDLVNWIQIRLRFWWNAHAPMAEPPPIDVFLLPCDTANRAFMIGSAGVSGFAGLPGVILLRVWPSPANLKRLDLLLARMIAYQAWLAKHHQLQKLEDWLEVEAAAAKLIQQVQPDVEHPEFASLRPASDWERVLDTIARQFFNLPSYDAVRTNIYGFTDAVGSERLPTAEPLPDDELAYSRDIIETSELLNETRPNQIAAALYGDAIVAAQGYPGIGLPAYAGFAVAGAQALEANVRVRAGG